MRIGAGGSVLSFGFAYCDEPDAGEYQHYGKGLERGEHVKAETHACDCCHYGLHVVIHAHQRGPQPLLANHYADIGKEGSA